MPMMTAESVGYPVSERNQTGVSLERTFLISSLPDTLDSLDFVDIHEQVLDKGIQLTTRIREEKTPTGESSYYLHLTQNEPQSAWEQHIPLTVDVYKDLLTHAQGEARILRRYTIVGDDMEGTLDVFPENADESPVIHLSFVDEQSAHEFVPPEWFGNEVSILEPVDKKTVVPSPVLVFSEELLRDSEKMYEQIDEMLRQSPQIFIFAAGKTNAGKSTAAVEQIMKKYSGDVVYIGMDDYYIGKKQLAEKQKRDPKINWDHPDAINMALLVDHLRALSEGKTIQKPVYDFEISEPKAETVPVTAHGKKIILVDGLFALQDRFNEFGGVRVFVDISLHGSVIRRLLRDVSRTKRDPATILNGYFHYVQPMYEEFIKPTKQNATIILRNEYNPAFESYHITTSEHQVKYETSISEEQFRLAEATRLTSMHQEDFYFNPKEGIMNDEMFRIRIENGVHVLTYKGPAIKNGNVLTRPKFEFVLDDDTAHMLLEYQDYGPIIKHISKDRTIYQWRGIELAYDKVTVGTHESIQILGSFLEVRFPDVIQAEKREQMLEEIQTIFSITSAPINKPYSLM